MAYSELQRAYILLLHLSSTITKGPLFRQQNSIASLLAPFPLNNSRRWGIKFYCMNTLDIIFCILIGASIIYSLIRGLVREIFSFLAVILGFLGASYGYGVVAQWLGHWMENVTLCQILGFIILLLLISLSLSLSGRILSGAVNKTGLGWADRMGGAAFGFLKAILLIAIIVLILTAFLPGKSALLSESRVAPNAMAIARGLSFLVPAKLKDLYTEKERDLKRIWATRELTGEKPNTRGGAKR